MRPKAGWQSQELSSFLEELVNFFITKWLTGIKKSIQETRSMQCLKIVGTSYLTVDLCLTRRELLHVSIEGGTKVLGVMHINGESENIFHVSTVTVVYSDCMSLVRVHHCYAGIRRST